MSAVNIIDGKAFAAALRGRIASTVPDFIAQSGRKPGLAVVLVGNDKSNLAAVKAAYVPPLAKKRLEPIFVELAKP